jgi:glyoxylase-like metal-dependent hydrolase (beta-lactamase superfamily II)
MLFESIPVGPLQCNCSLIADEQSHEAIVIDPGDDIADIIALVQRHGVVVKQIIVTHAHIDHVGGAMKLKKLTGAPVLLNENDAALLRMLPIQAAWVGMAPPDNINIDEPLRDAATLRVGALTGAIIHTPGHTQGSVCLYMEAEKLLIAGDTLFAGSIGRTDLPGGNFDQIMRSLHDRVLALPDETKVIPGHGPETTIGAERETNPFLKT